VLGYVPFSVSYWITMTISRWQHLRITSTVVCEWRTTHGASGRLASAVDNPEHGQRGERNWPTARRIYCVCRLLRSNSGRIGRLKSELFRDSIYSFINNSSGTVNLAGRIDD